MEVVHTPVSITITITTTIIPTTIITITLINGTTWLLVATINLLNIIVRNSLMLLQAQYVCNCSYSRLFADLQQLLALTLPHIISSTGTTTTSSFVMATIHITVTTRTTNNVTAATRQYL